jgi:glycosyltransferase involved in cell wall biosynthesis
MLLRDYEGNEVRAIAINGRFLTQRVTGVQRYAIELLQAMDAMLATGELEQPDVPVEVLVPSAADPAITFRSIRCRFVGKGSGQVWEQLWLPLACRGKLLFTPCGGAPLLHRHNVFTIPDAAVFATPQAYSASYGAWYRWHHQRIAKSRHTQFLTVSDFSKRELIRWLNIDERRLHVTPLGREHVFRASSDPNVLERLQLASGRYVLGVGSLHANKNFRGLLLGFQLMVTSLSSTGYPVPRLVLVGGANSSIFGDGDLSEEGVVRAGYLSDGELRSLYEHAGCFVFPSFYEGFGLPPLEAMSLGCPVACANAASLPEVCGEAAVLFAPSEPNEIAHAIERLMTDPLLRQTMITRGKERSSIFRWREAARATWAVLLAAARQ